ARGRKRPVEAIERVAEGRVWTGEAALAEGLVDRIGTFEDALTAVRKRIGVSGERLRPAILKGPRKGFPPLDPPKQRADALTESIGTFAARFGGDLASFVLAAGERVLAWSVPARLLS